MKNIEHLAGFKLTFRSEVQFGLDPAQNHVPPYPNCCPPRARGNDREGDAWRGHARHAERRAPLLAVWLRPCPADADAELALHSFPSLPTLIPSRSLCGA
jgi:hypothetical protein